MRRCLILKKKIAVILVVIFVLAIAGIIAISAYRSSELYRKKEAATIATDGIKETLKEYSQNSDDVWECEGYTYKYKLEITGRMHNAETDSTFVYLSNMKDISFDQAWKAAGLSSNSNDYFDVNDAVLVEWK